ncbi:dihydrofolate reductase [Liquorilactobacillus cacaonum]|uniref:Dihydrofolate reductase n=1 Tax=Liquorilactobacillus cacaonum DSM 21116 TaxID=1423729 RepID=A0A0R2CH91_9LACO|nr:dihydrofolate reductase [Liquorilactobacillus cacaonum]KRM90984.1 dihydrofolate reductase [Liquorilactobacillus cacaonum DSM 21116]
MLAYIWAEDKEHHIGLNGHLPWHLPADLAYFKKITKNHPIVMGRKTFDSFPGLLPQRHHFVLTNSIDLKTKFKDDDRITVMNNIDDLSSVIEQKDLIFIIGGASLFAEFADKVDFLYVTRINSIFPGDTKMPIIDEKLFELITKKNGTVDEKNKYPHVFEVYQRKGISQ